MDLGMHVTQCRLRSLLESSGPHSMDTGRGEMRVKVDKHLNDQSLCLTGLGLTLSPS